MPPELKRYDGLILGAPDVSTPRTVQALLMTEGKVTDRDEEYTTEQLEAISAATNEYLATGEDTPLFYSSHEYTTDAIAGGLQSGLFVAEMTEDNLPNPGMTDLIGKSGLFGTIAITMEHGLKAYSGGIKKISVGLAPDNVIYEVSMVPWGAIRGASLYSKKFTTTTTSAGNLLLKGLSDEDRDAIATYGLTIAQTTAEEAQVDSEDEAWEAFHRMNRTIRDIHKADEVSLQGNSRESLIEQAIATTAASFRSLYLPLPPEPVLPPLPSSTFTKERPMDPEGTNLDTADKQPDLSTYQKQVDDLTANNAKLADELNQMKMRQSVSAQYTRLRNKGESLIRQYKLTPAQFKATFGDDAEADIDKFLNPPEGEGGKYSLSNVEYHLSQLEQFGQAIAPTASGDNGLAPQEIADPNQDQYEAEYQTYRRKRGYTTQEAE